MKKFLLNIYYKLLNIQEKIIIFYNRQITSRRKLPTVFDTDITLNKIVDEKCSVSRYGDGEFALMYGEDLKFQVQNKELVLRLKEIMASQESGHIVCIPNIFGDITWWTEKAKKYWAKYLNSNLHRIYKLLDMDKSYYDTQVTRLYIDLEDKSVVANRFNKMKSLWEQKKVVIVEGNKSRLGVGDDLFEGCKSVERIICPSINAFSKYDEILEEVLKKDTSKLILIALGPTATVLAYDLAKLGYQAVDIGHIDIEYEWFLMGATEKCPVKNKYIGEINGGDEVYDMCNSKYESEITAKI